MEGVGFGRRRTLVWHHHGLRVLLRANRPVDSTKVFSPAPPQLRRTDRHHARRGLGPGAQRLSLLPEPAVLDVAGTRATGQYIQRLCSPRRPPIALPPGFRLRLAAIDADPQREMVLAANEEFPA